MLHQHAATNALRLRRSRFQKKKSGCDENIHTERAIATPGIEAVVHDVSTAALVAHTDVSVELTEPEAEAPDFKFPSRGLPRAGRGLEPRA